MLALQRSINGFDGQISYFTRYDRLHYSPDPLGDLLINGVASDVVRQSLPTASRPTARIRSLPRTPSAPAFSSAANRPLSAIHRWSSPSSAERRSMHLSMSPTMSRRPAISPACMRRTNGRSPTSSPSTPACASTRCGNSSAPTSSARASASPTHRSSTRSSTPGMRATSHRRCWSRQLRSISVCSATPRRRYLPTRETARFCRSGRIISTPASIKIFRSGAASRRRRIAPTSISVSTSTTKSRPISSTTVFSARLTC